MLTVIAAGLAALVATWFAFRDPRRYIVFLLCAGVLGFSQRGIISRYDLLSLWLAGLLGLALLVALRIGGLGKRLSVPEWLYGLFLLWCVYEAFRAPSLEYAARMFAKICYPLIVMFIARRAMLSGSEFRAAMSWILRASLTASLLVGGFTQRVFPWLCWKVGAKFLWACAAFADHASVVSGLALAAWRLTGAAGYAFLAAWLFLSSVLAGVRTGMGATAIAISIFVWLTFRKGTAAPILVGVYLAAAVGLFVLPENREYMFRDPSRVDTAELILRPTALSTNDINDHGRFSHWDLILDRFFWPDPLQGAGLGATQYWYYEVLNTPGTVEHSSYVRLLANTGVVGLLLYITAMVSCVGVGWHCFRSGLTAEVRACGLAVLCAFPALWFCMGFDNLLNYQLPATQYPFGFTGLALGMAERARRELWLRAEAGRKRAAGNAGEIVREEQPAGCVPVV